MSFKNQSISLIEVTRSGAHSSPEPTKQQLMHQTVTELLLNRSVTHLVVRYCKVHPTLTIVSPYLLILDLSSNQLASMPSLHTAQLQKLVLDNNLLKIVPHLPRSLKQFSILGNPICDFSNIGNSHQSLLIRHEVFSHLSKFQKKRFFLTNQTCKAGQILIKDLSESQIEFIMQDIISHNNGPLYAHIASSLRIEEDEAIAECIEKKKDSVLWQLLLRAPEKQQYDEFRLAMMDIALFNAQIVERLTLLQVMEHIRASFIALPKIKLFLKGLCSMKTKRFISSQAQFQLLLSYSNRVHDSCITTVLLQSKQFLPCLHLSEPSRIKLLLELDSPELVLHLSNCRKFQHNVIENELFRLYVRPTFSTYCQLLQAYKVTMGSLINQRFSFLSEYCTSDTMVACDDVYDFQVLQGYEDMHGSFLAKDLGIRQRDTNRSGPHFSIAKSLSESICRSISMFQDGNQQKRPWQQER